MVVACPVRNFENDTSQEQISLKKQGGRFGCRAKSKTCNQKTEKHDQKSTEIINMTTNGIFTLYTILPSTGNVFSLSLYFFGFFSIFSFDTCTKPWEGKITSRKSALSLERHTRLVGETENKLCQQLQVYNRA
jgi:hypothetical protein